MRFRIEKVEDREDRYILTLSDDSGTTVLAQPITERDVEALAFEAETALPRPIDLDGPDGYDDDDGLTDAQADAMTLSGAGWGTDEDYGYYGDEGGY